MTDKDSKNADKHEIESPLFEENIQNESANEGVNLDQLQDDFNSLVAGSDASYSEASYAQSAIPQISDPQLSDHLSAEFQDSTAPAPEQNASEQQASNENQAPYEQATDAFNDLADAFTIDSAPATGSDNNGADFSSHLDQSFNEFESSVAHRQVQSEEIDNFSATVQEIADDKFPAFDSDEHTPTSSYPISGGSIPSQSSSSLSQNSSPIHADLSGRSSGSFLNMPTMALAVTVLIVTGASIYLLTKTTNDKPVQIVQGEQLEIPEQADRSSTELTEERIPAATNRDFSEPNGTITSESEGSNSSTQIESEIPASLSTEDAIKLITQKRARDAAQSATQSKPQLQTVAPMQTFTPITPSTTSMAASNDNGDWVIIAPVISKPSALRYVASFKAKGIESEILQRTSKGLNKYFVRILGFNSQQDAEKRIKRLSMLGLRNAKVLKATYAWEGHRVVAQEATRTLAPATAPIPTPSSATVTALVPQQAVAMADQAPETGEADLTQQAAVSDKRKAAPKTSKAQPLQLVSEFDLDDESSAQSEAIQQASELDALPDQRATSTGAFKSIGRADTQLLEQISDIDAMPIDTPETPIRLQTPRATHPSIIAPATAFKQPIGLSSDPLIRAREIYNSSRATTPSSNSVSTSKSFARVVKAAPASTKITSTQAYQRPVSTTSFNRQKRWTIVASVDSSEKAKEYVDLFHSKYMESEAVELNVNGEKRHFVYIKGFTNEISAKKRRDRLVNQSILESTATVEEL